MREEIFFFLVKRKPLPKLSDFITHLPSSWSSVFSTSTVVSLANAVILAAPLLTPEDLQEKLGQDGCGGIHVVKAKAALY